MVYEFCLEYGTYPLIPLDASVKDRQKVPDFLEGNIELIKKIDELNTLFHQLFLTIECQFHYIGSEHPEKIKLIKQLYFEIIDELQLNYPEVAIHFEHFVL